MAWTPIKTADKDRIERLENELRELRERFGALESTVSDLEKQMREAIEGEEFETMNEAGLAD